MHDVAVAVLAGGRRVRHVLEVGAERLRADAVIQQEARLGLHPVLDGAHHRPDTVLDARLEAHHADFTGDFVLDAENLDLRVREERYSAVGWPKEGQNATFVCLLQIGGRKYLFLY